MAIQTARADLFRRRTLEREYLCFVSAALDVCFPRSMASLAAVPLRPLFRVQGRHIMRRIFKTLEKPFHRHVFMTRLAGFRPHIQRGIRLPHVLLLICLLVGSFILGRSGGYTHRRQKDHWETEKIHFRGLYRLKTHLHPSDTAPRPANPCLSYPS